MFAGTLRLYRRTDASRVSVVIECDPCSVPLYTLMMSAHTLRHCDGDDAEDGGHKIQSLASGLYQDRDTCYVTLNDVVGGFCVVHLTYVDF